MSENPYQAPQTFEVPGSQPTDAEAIRQDHIKTEASIKSVGILYWLASVAVVITSIPMITAAIGPVKAKFKGKLQLEDLQPPTSYQLRFEGQGGAAGHGKGTATVRLESTGPRSTVLHYTAKATVGGKIAQLGSRLVDMAAQKMATEFFETFNAKLQERYAVAVPEVVAVPAPQGLLARIAAWFKKLFGG